MGLKSIYGYRELFLLSSELRHVNACKIIDISKISRPLEQLVDFRRFLRERHCVTNRGDRRRRYSSLSGKVNEFWTRIKSAIDEGCTGGERNGGIRPSRVLNCTSSWPSSKLMKHRVRTLPVPFKFSLVSDICKSSNFHLTNLCMFFSFVRLIRREEYFSRNLFNVMRCVQRLNNVLRER